MEQVEDNIKIDIIPDDPKTNPAWLPDPGNLLNIHWRTDWWCIDKLVKAQAPSDYELVMVFALFLSSLWSDLSK